MNHYWLSQSYRQPITPSLSFWIWITASAVSSSSSTVSVRSSASSCECSTFLSVHSLNQSRVKLVGKPYVTMGASPQSANLFALWTKVTGSKGSLRCCTVRFQSPHVPYCPFGTPPSSLTARTTWSKLPQLRGSLWEVAEPTWCFHAVELGFGLGVSPMLGGEYVPTLSGSLTWRRRVMARGFGSAENVEGNDSLSRPWKWLYPI